MDEVTAAVQFEGCVYIFMRSGKVYEMYRDPVTHRLMFAVITELVPH